MCFNVFLMLIVMMQWKCVQSGSFRRNARLLVMKLDTRSLANVEPVTGSTLARDLVPSLVTGFTLARDITQLGDWPTSNQTIVPTKILT